MNMVDIINSRKYRILAVDFDGTLCENKFPDIGLPKLFVINYVKMLKKKGWKIILWTARDGKYLNEAKRWCKKQGLVFDEYNQDLKRLQKYGFNSRKVFADYYLDDKNLTLDQIKKIK